MGGRLARQLASCFRECTACMRVHTFAAAELGSGEGRPSPDELEQRRGRVDLAAGHLVAPPVEREHHLLQLHVGRSIDFSLASRHGAIGPSSI